MAKKQQLQAVESKSKAMSTLKKQRIAVVTGAGRGIGRALVDSLNARGYAVVAVVRSLKDVPELFAIDPQNILPLRCDVTEPSTEAVLREFLEIHVDKVDLLVNNAGYGAKCYGIEGLDFDELDNVMKVHCHGPIRVVRACLPFLRQAKNAAIINVSSRFGSVEWVATATVPPDQATYAYRIAKAAMNMFTSCLAVELKPEGIRVLSVDPGKVKTRFGPVDADTEPSDAAEAIINLVENGSQTAQFVRASGEKLPW